jgi:hypothetical protein
LHTFRLDENLIDEDICCLFALEPLSEKDAQNDESVTDSHWLASRGMEMLESTGRAWIEKASRKFGSAHRASEAFPN